MTDTADTLIDEYLRTKDHLAAQQKAFNDFCKPYRDRMDAIESRLREMLLAMGDKAEAIRTASGTCYTSVITTPGIENRDVFLKWCGEHWNEGGNEMLQLGKPQIEAYKTYMEQHEGQLPPGTKVSHYTQLNIRRS